MRVGQRVMLTAYGLEENPFLNPHNIGTVREILNRMGGRVMWDDGRMRVHWWTELIIAPKEFIPEPLKEVLNLGNTIPVCYRENPFALALVKLGVFDEEFNVRDRSAWDYLRFKRKGEAVTLINFGSSVI